MKTVPAGEFKAKCLRLMDEVRESRLAIVITKNGQPVAKLVPLDDDRPVSMLGCLEGQLEILGDLLDPVVDADAWDAQH